MIVAVLIKWAVAVGLARFAIAMIIFPALERVVPQRKGEKLLRDGWGTDLLCFLLNGTLFAAIFWAWHRVVPQLPWMKPLPWTFQGKPVIVQALGVMAVGSFMYYWGHRALHTFPLLWRFHSVHHSITNLDWLATYRGHVFETFYFTAVMSVPMAWLGISAPAGMAFIVYRFVEGQIEHSNIRLPLGWLRYVLPSPWFHQWHHAWDAEARNKNFAPYPIWDILFGTAFMPKGRFPERFGIEEPLPVTYTGLFAYPFGLAPLVARFRRSALPSPS